MFWSYYTLIASHSLLVDYRYRLAYTGNIGGAENDGHENDGPSKLQGMKLQDMKL